MSRGLQRPPRLRKGGTIALVAPSSQCEAESIAHALEFYRKEGYKVVLGDNVRVLRRDSYFAASVDDRVSELHAAFKDDEVDAIFAVRGGIGASWLLPHLDYDLVRDDPKILMGYSDITSLHIALLQRSDLVCFHGPAGGLYPGGGPDDLKARRENLRRAVALLGRAEPWGEVRNPPASRFVRTAHPGSAVGPLFGGNLSLVTELVGTPWDPRVDGSLFFFEGVQLAAANVDRGLVQLYLAGKLRACAGLIAGEFAEREKPEEEGDPSIEDVLVRWFAAVGKPAVEGFTIGHGRHKLLVPLGVAARLDADRARLVITGRAVD